MPGFPIPANEKARLRELQSLRFKEWGASDALDDLCAIAARLLHTPIAHLSLVDRNEQLFAAKTGLEADRTERAMAFCARTIMTPTPLIVEDAANDPRFRQNPLVTRLQTSGPILAFLLKLRPASALAPCARLIKNHASSRTAMSKP